MTVGQKHANLTTLIKFSTTHYQLLGKNKLLLNLEGHKVFEWMIIPAVADRHVF